MSKLSRKEFKDLLLEWKQNFVNERNNPFNQKSKYPVEFIPITEKLSTATFDFDIIEENLNDDLLVSEILKQKGIDNFDIERLKDSITIEKLVSNSHREGLIFKKNKDYTTVMLNLLREKDNLVLSHKTNMTDDYMEKIDWKSDTPVIISTNIGDVIKHHSVDKQNQEEFQKMVWAMHDILHNFENYEENSDFTNFIFKSGLSQDGNDIGIIKIYQDVIRDKTGNNFNLEAALGASNWIQSLTSDVGTPDIYATIMAGLPLLDIEDIDKLDLTIDTESNSFKKEYSKYLDSDFINKNQDLISEVSKQYLKEIYQNCIDYIENIFSHDRFRGKCIIMPTF